MARGRDGKVLGKALHDAENDGMKDRHGPNQQLDRAPPPARHCRRCIVTDQDRSRKSARSVSLGRAGLDVDEQRQCSKRSRLTSSLRRDLTLSHAQRPGLRREAPHWESWYAQRFVAHFAPAGRGRAALDSF
jgi:hypothetical protein